MITRPGREKDLATPLDLRGHSMTWRVLRFSLRHNRIPFFWDLALSPGVMNPDGSLCLVVASVGCSVSSSRTCGP